MSVKKTYILLIAIVFSFTTVTAQDLTKKRMQVIDGFMKAVFVNNKNSQYITANYMYLKPYKEADNEKRLKIISYLIDSLKTNKSIKINLDKRIVVPYDIYSKKKVPFSKMTEDIFIVDVGTELPIYFLFEKDKIISFYYIKKGEDGYFILV